MSVYGLSCQYDSELFSRWEISYDSGPHFLLDHKKIKTRYASSDYILVWLLIYEAVLIHTLHLYP